MSLKAKLEAVIYAAEEPVTLAQLAMLFANEALEWKAEQQSVARAAQEAGKAEASRTEPAQLPLTAELTTAEPLPAEAEPSDAEAPAQEEATINAPPANTPPEPGEAPAESADTEEMAFEGEPENAGPVTETTEAEQDAAGVEADARRAARQREREVRNILREVLDEIVASYASDGRGVEIREIAGGYRMATKPECHDAVRMFVKSLTPSLKLSLPASRHWP